MITERANIIRQNRKNIKIIIAENGDINIYAPKYITNKEIEKLVGNKEAWATKKSTQKKQRRETNRSIFDYKAVLICGKQYDISYCEIKKIGVYSDKLLVPIKYAAEKLLPALKKWYKSLAKEMLSKRLLELSHFSKLKYSEAKIGDYKAKWGSCDSDKCIKLNYKLVMLPHKLIDAVLLHELVHTKEMNHSRAFYTKLIALMPEYKKYRAELKDYGYLLKLY